MRILRYIIISLVLIALVFITAGSKAVELGWISQDNHILWSAVLGSGASILALLSFIKPPLTKTDLKTTHLDDLKRIAQTASELEQISERKSQAESDLQKLERQRQQLKLLVSKASLVLYLHDKRATLEQEILDGVRSNPDLEKMIEAYRKVKEQLAALNEEMNESSDLTEILSVIEGAERISSGSKSTSMLEFLVELALRPLMRGL